MDGCILNVANELRAGGSEDEGGEAPKKKAKATKKSPKGLHKRWPLGGRNGYRKRKGEWTLKR